LSLLPIKELIWARRGDQLDRNRFWSEGMLSEMIALVQGSPLWRALCQRA